MLEFINDINLDYNLYRELRTRKQLHISYFSIIETFELLNKYLSYVQQYIKWIEQMYPGITNKKIVKVVKQIYTNIQPRLLNTYALYWKLHAYMQIIIPPAMPVAMPLPFPAEESYLKN
jgi:hypothetical protein